MVNNGRRGGEYSPATESSARKSAGPRWHDPAPSASGSSFGPVAEETSDSHQSQRRRTPAAYPAYGVPDAVCLPEDGN